MATQRWQRSFGSPLFCSGWFRAATTSGLRNLDSFRRIRQRFRCGLWLRRISDERWLAWLWFCCSFPAAEAACAHFNSTWNDFLDVGSLANNASPYSVLDMVGNGWEWVSSACRPYLYSAADGRDDLTQEQMLGTRGGGQDSGADELTTTHRGRHVSRNCRPGPHNIGIHCAR
jgi:formylglycine-generating enzyme required for sulfatase activity